MCKTIENILNIKFFKTKNYEYYEVLEYLYFKNSEYYFKIKFLNTGTEKIVNH